MRLNRRSIEGTLHAYEEVTSVDRVKEDSLTRVHLPCLEGTSCFSNERSFLSAHPVHTQLVTARGRRDGAADDVMPSSYKYVTFSGRERVLWVELHERSSLLEKAGWQRAGRDWLFINLSLKRMLEHVAGADEVHHDRC